MFLSSFNHDEATVLAQASERNFGGRNFDLAVKQRLVESFEEQHGTEIRDSLEVMRRLSLKAAKARSVLCQDVKSVINEDVIKPGLDLQYVLTLEEFESLIKPDLILFEHMLCNLKERIRNLDKAVTIHSIELMSDSSRI